MYVHAHCEACDFSSSYSGRQAIFVPIEYPLSPSHTTLPLSPFTSNNPSNQVHSAIKPPTTHPSTNFSIHFPQIIQLHDPVPFYTIVAATHASKIHPLLPSDDIVLQKIAPQRDVPAHSCSTLSLNLVVQCVYEHAILRALAAGILSLLPMPVHVNPTR